MNPDNGNYPLGGKATVRFRTGGRRILRKALPIALLVLIVAGAGIWARNIVQSASAKKPANDQVNLAAAQATTKINRSFDFPIRDSKGNVAATVSYVLDTAELRDQIIVKGQKATAIQGRTFLILSLHVVNNTSKEITMNTRDYVRLAVNGDESQWYAADIHNDPITIQPISTKDTRIGFPVNTTDKNFILQIGEIDGEKQRIPLNF